VFIGHIYALNLVHFGIVSAPPLTSFRTIREMDENPSGLGLIGKKTNYTERSPSGNAMFLSKMHRNQVDP
jgi:hypothetical protein